MGVAYVDLLRCTIFSADNRHAVLAAAEASLVKALSLAPDHAFAHSCLGIVQAMTNRATQGIAECERALALIQTRLALIRRSALLRLSLDTLRKRKRTYKRRFVSVRAISSAHVWITLVGAAKLALYRDEEAVAWLRRAIETNRNYPNAHLWLAAALAHLGQLSEAGAQPKLGSRLIRRSRSHVTERAHRATIQFILPSASGFLKACARRGCRRNERSAIFS